MKKKTLLRFELVVYQLSCEKLWLFENRRILTLAKTLGAWPVTMTTRHLPTIDHQPINVGVGQSTNKSLEIHQEQC